jgi:hypothetical protein
MSTYVDPDGLHYWIDTLPGERAQMWADLVRGGQVVSTFRIGSPAPREAVERDYLRKIGREA